MVEPAHADGSQAFAVEFVEALSTSLFSFDETGVEKHAEVTNGGVGGSSCNPDHPNPTIRLSHSHRRPVGAIPTRDALGGHA
ncbi:MAG: hypothetical protein ACJA0V_004835, partial [Planctomycetota bacterium]